MGYVIPPHQGVKREPREIGTYIGVTKQKRELVQPFEPQPSGDLVVVLAGVCLPSMCAPLRKEALNLADASSRGCVRVFMGVGR